MNRGRGLGGGGGRGKGHGMGRCGGGRGMGTGRSCRRGAETGPDSQSGSAWVTTAAPTDMQATPPTVESSGYRMIAMVDRDACVSCGVCVDSCPECAISMDALVVVDPKRCTGFGACIAACPNEALSLGRQTPAAARGVTG